MNKVARIAHYASLDINGDEVYGVATLVAGGYTFRPDDSREVVLVTNLAMISATYMGK